jgi:hypothetical protein
MFLPEEDFSEINRIFIQGKPLEPVDKNNDLQNMDSLYELEDYIKENIYDKKYPGILPDIKLNSPDDYSNEDQEQKDEKELILFSSSKKLSSTSDKKYKIISKSTDIILFNEENYSTNDEDEFAAINLLNEDRNEGNDLDWVLSVTKDNIKIYYKQIRLKNEENKDFDTLIFYVEAILDIPSYKVNEYINDINFRKEFDSLYNQVKVLSENEDESNNLKIIELYFYMKMPVFISDRDFVVRKKIWNEYNNKKGCYLIHLKSIENSEYPPKQKPVRGKFINRAAYICPYMDEEREKCKLYLASCFDMKMSFGVSMMKSKGSEGQGKWVEELIKNINKHEK